MAANSEAAAVKARRQAERATEANTAPKMAPVVGQDQPARHEKLLFSPDEPRMVAEATGSLYGTQRHEEIPGYTIAPADAYETFTPSGCKTPVTRMRWTKGQHVPTEVYNRHVAAQAAAEPGA